MDNTPILSAPGIRHVCDGNSFQTAVALGGKPLKRFSRVERFHTRLKPGANEKLPPRALMKLKYPLVS